VRSSGSFLEQVVHREDGGIMTIELLPDDGIGIRAHGYGTADSADGHGLPIVVERWQGRLRIVCWPDINSDDPTIIDLEGAREINRLCD
jgi:hypothetical protein